MEQMKRWERCNRIHVNVFFPFSLELVSRRNHNPALRVLQVHSGFFFLSFKGIFSRIRFRKFHERRKEYRMGNEVILFYFVSMRGFILARIKLSVYSFWQHTWIIPEILSSVIRTAVIWHMSKHELPPVIQGLPVVVGGVGEGGGVRERGQLSGV